MAFGRHTVNSGWSSISDYRFLTWTGWIQPLVAAGHGPDGGGRGDCGGGEVLWRAVAVVQLRLTALLGLGVIRQRFIAL